MNDPFGISKADDRKKNLAIAGAGGTILAGTASLQQAEGRVLDHRRNRVDRQIAHVQSQIPKKTPVAERPSVHGQIIGATHEAKQKRKYETKRLYGQIHELNAKKNALRRPRLAGNAKATWTGIALGTPLLAHGVRQQFQKDFRRRDADAGMVGAGLGAGAYQESSYKLKGMDRKAEAKIAADPHLKAKARAYRASSGLPKDAKAGDRAWHGYFRNYPKDLPGARLKRTLAVTHTGKTGGAFTLAAAGAGAAGAANLSRVHREHMQKNFSPSAFGVDHG